MSMSHLTTLVALLCSDKKVSKVLTYTCSQQDAIHLKLAELCTHLFPLLHLSLNLLLQHQLVHDILAKDGLL